MPPELLKPTALNRQTGTYTRWVCWHPVLGFLKFGSYFSATASDTPDPRGCYSRKSDAEKRRRDCFFCNGKKHDGKDIVVKMIRYIWEV